MCQVLVHVSSTASCLTIQLSIYFNSFIKRQSSFFFSGSKCYGPWWYCLSTGSCTLCQKYDHHKRCCWRDCIHCAWYHHWCLCGNYYEQSFLRFWLVCGLQMDCLTFPAGHRYGQASTPCDICWGRWSISGPRCQFLITITIIILFDK